MIGRLRALALPLSGVALFALVAAAGQPPQLPGAKAGEKVAVPTISVQAAAPGEGSVTVLPGPDPWYTVFGTGEVIGFIEPCG